MRTAVPIRDSELFPGRHEIEPELWWQALRRAATQILDRAPIGERVAAICIGGASRAQVFLDADGKPLRAALLFRDRRDAEAEEARKRSARLPSKRSIRSWSRRFPRTRARRVHIDA